MLFFATLCWAPCGRSSSHGRLVAPPRGFSRVSATHGSSPDAPPERLSGGASALLRIGISLRTIPLALINRQWS